MSHDSLNIVKGTVLAIPLSSGVWALGQVIYPGVKFYMGICSVAFYEPLSASDIDSCAFSMFSWTNDAEVFRGNWKNLGVSTIKKTFELPEYRVAHSGKMVVESFSGDSWREFDPGKDSKLKYRTVRSPLLVQDAVQAACGYGEWKPFYDRMKMI